jgi:uncharacterized membrane protein
MAAMNFRFRSFWQPWAGTRPQLANRDIALDALRTLAIVGMVATHSTRMIPLVERWPVHRWAMLLEPIIPALFLALAGASLVLSHHHARQKKDFHAAIWLKRQGVRALGLWAISVVFYLCQDGWHWPDTLIAPGILGTIGFAIMSLGALLLLPQGVWFLAFAMLGAAGLQIWMDIHELKWVWFTTGNSPVLPLVTFAWAGGLYTYIGLGMAKQSASTQGKSQGLQQGMAWGLGVLGFLGIWFLIQKYGVEALFSKPLGRSDAGRVFEIVQGDSVRKVTLGYYNMRPILCAAIVCIVVCAHQLLRGLSPWLRPLQKGLFAMGRHSLGVYILHLSLLAMAVLIWGKRPFPTAVIGAAVYLSLLAICEMYALFRERGLGAKESLER